MRAVVQRVTKSSVIVEKDVVGAISNGITVLLGIGNEDSHEDIKYLAEKIINLRIFEDSQGKMNLSLLDVGGELLIISQFTLYGDCRKGRRPGYDKAARPEIANELYEEFVKYCRDAGIMVSTGKFQAEMMVEIHNHGPVTLLLDSKKEF